MKHSYLFPIALAIVAVILSAVYISGRPAPVGTYSAPVLETPSSKAPAPQVTPSSQNTSTSGPSVVAYTMAEISLHASERDCWTTVNGNVYDVTAWIAKHPGGASAILSLCGTDGSGSFNGQHGGQRRPESELASFIIGTLK